MSRLIAVTLCLTAVRGLAQAPAPQVTMPQVTQAYSATNALGLMTNKAAVLSISVYARTNFMPSPWANTPPPPTNLPVEIQERLLARRTQAVAQVSFTTNGVFQGFVPESLQNTVWTNFIARTNGRSMLIWSERSHSPNWPATPPIVKWNTNSLIWGMKGMTALSPCWEGEDYPGMEPITALTKRHGYTRGHDMGFEGLGKGHAGKRVWFLTPNNNPVEVTVVQEVVRTMKASGQDYTILLFNKDLPDSIQPLRVAASKDVFSRYTFLDNPVVPRPFFLVEQGGNVSAEVPGFTVPTWKGGDSGSANLLPLPGELVFYGGRSTSGPSPEMQTDMDELCRQSRLDPAKYRLQWVDLSQYPKY